MRKHIKGYLAGILTMILLFGATLVLANEVVTRQIAYGVNVVVNGQRLQLDGIDRPFIMDGRTFLPVRVVADALGVPADWDGATSTVYLGSRTAGPVRTSINSAAPFFDSGGNGWNVSNVDSIAMGGTTYNNAVRYNVRAFNNSHSTGFSLHNLNGQYRTFSGFFGRVDGSGMHDVTINVIGDGSTLRTIELRSGELPTEFTIFVEGVNLLRIEFVTNFNNGNFSQTDRTFGMVGFVE